MKRKLGKCKYCLRIKPLRYRDTCDSCYMKIYRARKIEEGRTIRRLLWITLTTIIATAIFILWFIFKILKI
jgi:hypothetical protein